MDQIYLDFDGVLNDYLGTFEELLSQEYRSEFLNTYCGDNEVKLDFFKSLVENKIPRHYVHEREYKLFRRYSKLSDRGATFKDDTRGIYKDRVKKAMEKIENECSVNLYRSVFDNFSSICSSVDGQLFIYSKRMSLQLIINIETVFTRNKMEECQYFYVADRYNFNFWNVDLSKSKDYKNILSKVKFIDEPFGIEKVYDSEVSTIKRVFIDDNLDRCIEFRKRLRKHKDVVLTLRKDYNQNDERFNEVLSIDHSKLDKDLYQTVFDSWKTYTKEKK